MSSEQIVLKIIGRIYTHFPTKFGIPRQSGLIEGLESRIVFEPAYRQEEAFRGLEGYEYIWIIWSFSEAIRTKWHATVRPPWLNGNKRMGVFATRSPYRPNPLAISSVRLKRIEKSEREGMVLIVEGADMKNGTPIYDIKPYLPYTDAHVDVRAGFSDDVKEESKRVFCSQALLDIVTPHLQKPLQALLAQNPAPRYQKDSSRIYGVRFDRYEVKFCVKKDGIHVVDIVEVED